MPESEARGAPNGRLMDKFPSNTTLWLVLRKFEAGVAGDGATRNLTGRGAPVTSGSGAGRLFYQTPVLQAMERELSSFADLQKTLGQLGFSSGSILLRLSFRTTERPLEEAMAEIEDYFKSVDENYQAPEAKTPSNVETPASSEPTEVTPKSTPSETQQPTPAEPSMVTEPPQSDITATPMAEATAATPLESQPIASSRPVTVYAPPSGNTPQSARFTHNEEDYIPTVDHAKAHQHFLNTSSRNQRLASDAELAAQESTKQEKLAKITEIEVKLRFPDQSQVVSKFGRNDTAADLYGFVRSCLDEGLVKEAFSLSYFSGGGTGPGRVQSVIPDSAVKYLIKDVKMGGRVLVNFVWDGNAALAARSKGAEILRPDLRKAAGQIKVDDATAVGTGEEEEKDKKSWMKRMGGAGGRGGSTGGNKVPKWLKLPGKK